MKLCIVCRPIEHKRIVCRRAEETPLASYVMGPAHIVNKWEVISESSMEDFVTHSIASGIVTLFLTLEE